MPGACVRCRFWDTPQANSPSAEWLLGPSAHMSTRKASRAAQLQLCYEASMRSQLLRCGPVVCVCGGLNQDLTHEKLLIPMLSPQALP